MAVVQNFKYQYLQIFFSNVIRENSTFERVIFQRQSDGSMIIVLHCSYINTFPEINIDTTLQSLISIFLNYRIFLDLFSQARLIDQMDWRSGQPNITY